MNTIIISGFGRFGDYPANTAEMVVRRLADKNIAGFKVHPVLFRAMITKGNRGRQLFRLARRVKASGIICLGMASEKTGLCIETYAANKIDNPKYCPAELNGTRIDASMPYGKKVPLITGPWSIYTFLDVCRGRGIPVMEPSEDADGFCCNHLMWQLCTTRVNSPRGKADEPFVFIHVHVPCCPEAVPDSVAFAKAGKKTMTTDQVIKGLTVLLELSSIC